MACMDAAVKLAGDIGVIDQTKLTAMERQAIRDARYAFAATLEQTGLMPHFENLPAATIDALITAAVEGFRGSMQRQTATGDVPF